MFWNDPILYGYKDVNIPQVPFMNQMTPQFYNKFVPPYYGFDLQRMHQLPFVPQMQLPFQQLPIQQLPFQQLPFIPQMQLPIQQVPYLPFYNYYRPFI